MNNLPNDILSYIFKYIPNFTPFIRATNKRFNRVILDNNFDLMTTVNVVINDDMVKEIDWDWDNEHNIKKIIANANLFDYAIGHIIDKLGFIRNNDINKVCFIFTRKPYFFIGILLGIVEDYFLQKLFFQRIQMTFNTYHL